MLYHLDRLPLTLLLLTVFAATLAAGGCETSGRRDANLPDIAVGDAALPVGAELVASNREGDLTYTAEADGVLYVYDNQEKEVVLIQRVARGVRFSVAPERSLATLDGQPVARREGQPRLRAGRVYQIYFYRVNRPPADRS